MKKKKKETILAKVKTAVAEVSDAATDLDKLLKEVKAAPRAEKTTVSKVVSEAFARLKAARSALVEVEEILEKEKDE